MDAKKDIGVYADWQGLEQPRVMGILHGVSLRSKEIFLFEYDKNWLKSSFAQKIDPDLELFAGYQYVKEGKSNFGVFLDSSPDRWGRVLMERRETILAKLESRPRKNLMESDFLLGVFDEHRTGALRFKTEENGDFQNYNEDFTTPPFTSIRELEQASYNLENELITDDSEVLKWLNMLLAPGSSLGGARPKASVADTNGNLYIAKFPSKNDTFDVGAWEMIVNELARKAGINAAQATARKFYGNHHTFLTKRFDRENTDRIHFASAMTLLGYNDGASFQENVSYLEIVEFIIRNGSDVNADLEELFRRIVFSVCVKNTDDHLRNHGFLLVKNGWTLSPAFDINPNPKGTGLKLNISEYDNSLDLNLLRDVAHYFRISKDAVENIVANTKAAVSQWQILANKYDLSREEQSYMNAAFNT
ncbi:MAG: HipA domain-containing protein [Tannerella sp.]|jgi:serine/threonine-protein kinase HipA|nr:HipA domain-containing protein [Tannerella sp.]